MSLFSKCCYSLFFFILLINCTKCLRSYTKDDIRKLREEVRDTFQHAYEGYLTYASEYDELRPLSCDGIDTWGSYSLTLIDALDTLVVMGNYTEFERIVEILTRKSNFDSDINVSVFETNIRIVGGLLSAHLLSYKAGIKLEPGWPCNGPLLRLAEDVAKRLLPAFDSKTGMPYGTVNLKNGVPPGETSVTCTAGVGTFIIEFGTLSRLTGDPIYEEIALNAIYSLYKHKSPIGLYGNHIDVRTGRWTAQDAGIGAGIDSYYEYLVKGAILLNRPELLELFIESRKAIDKFLKRDDWYIWVSMNKGTVTLPVFQSLEAYWPGLLSLIGETVPAMKTIHNYHSVWKQYGFLPEFYNIPSAEAGANRENYPLRPELVESAMYLYRATGDPYLLEIGEDMLRSIQHSAKTPCGYATIKNVRDHRKEDRMESFFLAETTKYLYLLFDPDNFLNNDGGIGTIIDTPNGECLIDAGGYIFNTEAHPIDPSALRCCYDLPRQNLLENYDRKYYLGESFDINENVGYHHHHHPGQPVNNFDVLNVPKNDISLEIQTKIDPEITRRNIISEILSVLRENKQQKSDVNSSVTNISVTTGDRARSPDDSSRQSMSNVDDNQKPIENELNDDLIKQISQKQKEILAQIKDTQRQIEQRLQITQNEFTDDDNDHDDSIILPKDGIVTKINQKQPPIDTLRYPPTSNSETNENVTQTTRATSTSTQFIVESTDQQSKLNGSFEQNVSLQNSLDYIFDKDGIRNSDDVSNNSMLTEFVQSLLKSTLPPKVKFDPQKLLENIRATSHYRNVTQNFSLFNCKSQNFLQRITVLGEFF